MTALERAQEILSDTFAIITQGNGLPKPDSVAHCLTRLFCTLLGEFVEGQSKIQDEMAHLVAMVREGNDPLIDLLPTDGKIALAGLTGLLISQRKERFHAKT